MELYDGVVCFHINSWFWGESVDIVKTDGTAIICVKYDKQLFPKTGYICNLSVAPSKRNQGLGTQMLKYAIYSCQDNHMNFARLHVDAKNIWLKEWYERLGFKELSRDENEIELIKEL